MALRSRQITRTTEQRQTLLLSASNQVSAATINRRLDSVVDKYGFNSPIAQNEMMKVIDAVPIENLKFKNGVPHITKPGKLAKNGVDLSGLKSEVKTVKEIRKEEKESYEEYKQEQEFEDEEAIDIDDFIIKKSQVKEMQDKIKQLSADPSQFDNGEQLLEMLRQPVKTYSEMFNIVSMLEGD